MTEGESLKSVLNSIFCRRGKETENTRLFENLPQQVQAELSADIFFRRDELSVLASVLDTDRWLLITTQRIFFNRKGELTSLDCAQLANVTPALVVDASKGIRRKNELMSLKVVSKLGVEQIIEVESGSPYFGVLNVLMHIKAKYSQT